jgi:hypothetical protein
MRWLKIQLPLPQARDLQIPCDARKRETEIQFFPKLFMLESHFSKIYSKNICVVAFGAHVWRSKYCKMLFFVLYLLGGLSHVVHLKAVDFTHPGQRISRFSDCLLFVVVFFDSGRQPSVVAMVRRESRVHSILPILPCDVVLRTRGYLLLVNNKRREVGSF